MTLEALADTERIALAADWVELGAMLSSRQTASAADLARSRSVLEEPEHELIVVDSVGEQLEEEILQSRSEMWISDVREELGTRRIALGDAYPFAVVESGLTWRLTLREEPDRHDHLFYLCCLLITAKRHGLLEAKHEVRDMDKVMQIIAYLVAARIVQGTAYWFGYPRPDNTGRMGQAVYELLRRMGFESPALVPPVWSVGTENDGGIDVVAWKNFGDGLPARLVLYGQVASGKNWEGKSVARDADSTFPSWVGNYGQRYYFPVMFIPWQQYLNVQPTHDRSFRQRVTETSIKQEKIFGLTVDRGRIAELATKSTQTGNGDEADWVRYLTDWRAEVLAVLRD
jgi:hypothetical protein